MPVNRVIVLLVIGGGLTVFVLSNLSSPVLPLVFLGTQTQALPLTLWVGLAIAAGAITSFVLQFLSYLHTDNWKLDPDTQERSRPPRQPRTRSQVEEPEPERSYSPPPPQTPASDWEETIGEDWDFEPESTPPPSDQDEIKRDHTSDTPQTTHTYETPQEPTHRSTNGSVYSYSYRESRESRESTRPRVNRPDEVYDANYRVIIPPYQQPPAPVEEDEEEDWGFEDDEDFDRDEKR